MRTASLATACLLAASFLTSPAGAQTPWNAERGLVLVGKVVTMNDAGDVLPNARVWLAGGRIMALARAGEALPDAAKDAPVIDSKGAIYPGIIDLHNHPEYAIYPLLPIARKYRDRYEWRWYDDAYNRRITYPQEVLTRAYYLDLGLEVGRYGEYKALAGGTTSSSRWRSAPGCARTSCWRSTSATYSTTPQPGRDCSTTLSAPSAVVRSPWMSSRSRV